VYSDDIVVKELRKMKLDVGCGLHKRGDVGVDINRESKADIIADAHYLPFREESFNKVSVYAVLEHVDYPQKVLKEINRVCEDGAHVMILVPISSRMFMNLLIYFFTFQFRGVISIYKCNKKGEHKWQYSTSSLKRLLEKHGFRILDVRLSPPDFYGTSNQFFKKMEQIHRRQPIYKPHLVVEGTKL